MKTIKTKITMLFAAALFILVLSPAVKAEASIMQTEATANTATITWDAATSGNAAEWVLYINDQYLGNLPISQTSYTISGLAQGTVYIVDIYYSNGTYNNSILVRTKPNNISTTSVSWNKKDSISVKVLDPDLFTMNGKYYSYADGFVFKIMDVNGKVRKTFSSVKNEGVATQSFTAPKTLKNKGMQYSIQSYITLDNGTKVYSDAVTKVAIPQPKIQKMQVVGTNKIKVTWSKITGAKNYTIYKTTNSGKTFKKVKTVSSKTTSYTVSNFKKGSKYGVLIVANNVTVAKKKYNSTRSYYTYRY